MLVFSDYWVVMFSDGNVRAGGKLLGCILIGPAATLVDAVKLTVPIAIPKHPRARDPMVTGRQIPRLIYPRIAPSMFGRWLSADEARAFFSEQRRLHTAN